MKKIIISILVVMAMVVTSCKSDDDTRESIDCAALAQASANASDAYDNDDSSENCIALRNSLQALIDADCLDAESAATTSIAISFLTCD